MASSSSKACPIVANDVRGHGARPIPGFLADGLGDAMGTAVALPQVSKYLTSKRITYHGGITLRNGRVLQNVLPKTAPRPAAPTIAKSSVPFVTARSSTFHSITGSKSSASTSAKAGLLQYADRPPYWMMTVQMNASEIAMTATDMEWAKQRAHFPCFAEESGNKKKLAKIPKPHCGKQGNKIAVKHGNATVVKESRVFSWNKPYFMVFDKEVAEVEDPDFVEAMKDALLTSFGYHCDKAGSKVNTGYFEESWNDAKGIAVLFSDCGNEAAEDCTFLVLGFAFLRTYLAPSLNKKFKLAPNVDTKTRMAIPGSDNVMYDSALYIDVVCSRWSVGMVLMKIFCGMTPRLGGWRDLLLRTGSKAPYLVLLRALRPVYTYYPLQYGFRRTRDGKYMYPIFSVVPEKLAALGHGSVEQVFGPSDAPNGDVVWRMDGSGVCHVYAVKASYKQFLKDTGFLLNHDARAEVLKEVPMVCGDSINNGFLYGMYVP